MSKKIVGDMYVVYEGRTISTSIDDAEILLTTADQQEAIAHAQAYNGAVYMYEVTEDDDYVNERVVPLKLTP